MEKNQLSSPVPLGQTGGASGSASWNGIPANCCWPLVVTTNDGNVQGTDAYSNDGVSSILYAHVGHNCLTS